MTGARKRLLTVAGVTASAGLLWWFMGASIKRKILRLAVPSHGQWMVDPIEKAAAEFKLDPFLLAGIAYWESDFGRAQGYSPKGAADGWGDGGNARTPWQIDKRYHAAFVYGPKVGDIYESTRYAAGLIAAAAKRFPNNPAAIIASYNAGPGAVAKAIAAGKTPDSVTHKGTYVASVLDRLKRLGWGE